MTEFRVEVVRLGPIEKHPNADTLSIAQVLNGYPCVFRTGDFQEGSLAVYVPIDALVPPTERFAFLGKHSRIKAKKLRGVFSMGLLTPVEPGWTEGQLVDIELGITKWEPLEEGGRIVSSDSAPAPPVIAPHYDIEGLRRYQDVLQEGEEVIITEKIHGANARFVFVDGALHVGSRTRWIKETESATWWRAARKYQLEEKLSEWEGCVFYGEIFGQVQDLKYGAGADEVRLAFFDVRGPGGWLDYDKFLGVTVGLPRVPELYRGPWREDLRALCEGNSTLAEHVREGFVVKPAIERWHESLGRVILKMVGEGYHLR